MTVMIVDDSAPMRGLLREVVAPLADHVVECADGAEFLAGFDACQPDWTVMDVRMPRLDGVSATRLLHARHPGACVLLVTQFPSPAILQAASEAGAVACLAKEELYRIPEFLPGGSRHPGAARPGAVTPEAAP